MASVAAGRAEEAFECYPAATEARMSWLGTGYLGHACPTDAGPQGSRGLETQPGPPPAYRIFPNCSPLISLWSLSKTQAEWQRGTWHLCQLGISKNLPRKPPSAIFPSLPPDIKWGEAGEERGRSPEHAGPHRRQRSPRGDLGN